MRGFCTELCETLSSREQQLHNAKIFVLQCTCKKYDLTWLKTYWFTQFQPKLRERAGERFGVGEVKGRLARAKSGAERDNPGLFTDRSLPQMSLGAGWWEILWWGWAWNSGNQPQTLSSSFGVRSAKRTESNEAKLPARDLRFHFLPDFPCSSFYLPDIFYTLLPPLAHVSPSSSSPSLSLWQAASLELLRDVLLPSSRRSENWFPALHFSSVVIPSCLLYSCFALTLSCSHRGPS